MDSVEFVSKIKHITKSVESIADHGNRDYRNLIDQYVSHNSPVKIGESYSLINIGSRTDLTIFDKPHNTFHVDVLNVDFGLDGSPFIVAIGRIKHSPARPQYKKQGEFPEIGTFNCIVHGTTTKVVFKKAKEHMSKTR